MANQANNEDYEVINLNHLNKDGLLAHIFNMCLEEKDKGIVRFCNNATQADKLRLICIYLNRMKNQLVHQVNTMQRCWMEELEAFKDDLNKLRDMKTNSEPYYDKIEKMENELEWMIQTLNGDVIPEIKKKTTDDEEEDDDEELIKECRTCRKPVKESEWNDVSEEYGSLKIECNKCHSP